MPSAKRRDVLSGLPAQRSEEVRRPAGSDVRVAALAAAIVSVAALVALQPLWAALHHEWSGNGLYGHGHMLLAMAVWLGWRTWRFAPPPRVAPDWRFALPVAGLVGLLILFDLLLLNVPRVYLLPPLFAASAGLVAGRAAAARLAPAAFLMYFALPLWEFLNAPLQAMTTAAVSRWLAWSGVPALIEGNFVHLAAGTFEIAADCSGLRYLLVGAAIAAFWALAFLSDTKRRLALVAAAVVLTVLSNWIRVYTIILAGHATDMQHYLVAVEHIRFGWVVFAIALLPLIWLGRRLEQPVREARPARERSAVDGRAMLRASLVAVVLLALPPLVDALEAGNGRSVPVSTESSFADEVRPWDPVFVNAVETWSIDVSGVPPVDVYRAVYEWQDEERRLIRYGNGFAGERWRGVASRRIEIDLGGERIDAIELEGYVSGERRVIWGWYWVAGRAAAGPLRAKLLELAGLVHGRRDAAAVAVSARCRPDCERARERLSEFVASSETQLKWRD